MPDENTSSPKPRTKAVYMISEREGARSLWTRIGSAWENRDGSITLRLDALPLSGTLQVRDAPPSASATPEPG